MMTIGILSDIHAQLEPLERAIEYLLSRNVDKIICAGDLVEKGEQGDEVVALLRQMLIPSVQGNHDENAVCHDALQRQYDTGPRLAEETIDYLDNLPAQLDYLWEGSRVTVTHGIPGRNDVYFFEDKAPKAFRKWSRTRPTDLLILGHTHRPMLLWYNDILVLNPGSVADARRRDSHSCALLKLPSWEIEIVDLTDESVLFAYAAQEDGPAAKRCLR